MERKTALHSGDMGDIIYAIPTLKHLEVGKIYLGTIDPITKFRKAAALNIKRLLEKQGFEVEITNSPQLYLIDYNMDEFRSIESDLNRKHLGYYMALAQGVQDEVDFKAKSITCKEPNKIATVVINRSSRYQNIKFDWNYLLSGLPCKIIFIGLKYEYDRFCENTMLKNVSYYPTQDLWEATRVIAGSQVFIGNQSCPFAIAEGLKVNRIQETCDWAHNCEPQTENGMQVLTRQDLYYAKLKLYEWLGIDRKIAEPIINTTMLFTTCYINSDYGLRRMQDWIDYYSKRFDALGATHCFILDDCSDDEWLEKLSGVDIFNLRTVKDEKGNFKSIEFPEELPAGKIILLRFDEHLGRRYKDEYPGWWRSFSFGSMMARFFKFDKWLFIESDAYLFSERIMRYLKNQCTGSGSMWCPGNKIRETSIQWSMASDFYRFQKFFMIDGHLNEEFWFRKDCNRYQYTPEFLPLWTNNLEEVQEFIGDRYGDDSREGIYVDSDFTCNCTDISLNGSQHHNENNKIHQLKKRIAEANKKLLITN